MTSFIEISPLSKEISRHPKHMADNGRTDGHTDGQPDDTIPCRLSLAVEAQVLRRSS